MCQRYALKWIDMGGQTKLIIDADLWFPSHFNIAPLSMNPVIVPTPTGNRVRMMRWGLIPHGSNGVQGISRPTNARAESLMEKPVFRDLLADHRCVVPASGFYEWKHEGTRKVPFYICRKDHGLLMFSGLYDSWQDPAGETHESYTIITTAPNDVIAPIHDRMPVILTEIGVQRWLTPGTLSQKEMNEILTSCDPDLIEVYPVSSRVNKTVEDDERLIASVRSL